jgi:hypothetical protein
MIKKPTEINILHPIQNFVINMRAFTATAAIGTKSKHLKTPIPNLRFVTDACNKETFHNYMIINIIHSKCYNVTVLQWFFNLYIFSSHYIYNAFHHYNCNSVTN